jgi:hypothetical protein
MAKKKPFQHIFEGKSIQTLSMSYKKGSAREKNSKRSQIEDKKEIEAYLKKIKDKLKNDPAAQKKAAMIISLMLGDESNQKTKTKKVI